MLCTARAGLLLSLAGAGLAGLIGIAEPSGGPPEARDPRHVALLIGISDYKNFVLDGPPGMSDLEGPRNDVARMRQSLRRWNFDGDNVKVLLDAQATRAGVLEALRWVRNQASDSGDAVVIYWSGHGTSVLDRDGDEAKVNSRDSRDEALVPWDARRIDDPAQMILDDDLRAMLAEFRTRNVTIIVDACYSGTATRGAGDRARGPLLAAQDAQPSGLDPFDGPQNHTLISASSAYEVAQERRFGADSTQAFGILTYYLTEALDQADGDARYDDLMKDVRQRVRQHSVQQPQLEGVGTSRVFNVRGDVARKPYVTLQRQGDVWRIDAGAVHGVRVGAIYEVFGPEELTFAGTATSQVAVQRTGRDQAVVLVQSGGAPRPGARAILSRTPRGATIAERVDVFVDGSARDLAGHLSAIPWVRVGRSATAPIAVSRTAGVIRVQHRGVDVVPLDSARQREIRVGERTLLGYASGAGICEPLQRAFTAEALTQLRNPVAVPLLEVELRMVPTGTRAPDDDATSDTVFIGGTYDLFARVSATSGSTIYLSVAVAGYVSSSDVLYPTGDQMNQPFTLNRWVRIARALRATDPQGDEVLTAVASSDQYDLVSLLGSMPRCSSPAAANLDRSANPSDRKWSEQTDPVQGWRAVHRRIVFERPRTR